MGLLLDPVFDEKDHHQLEAYVLSCKIKYARLVKWEMKGKSIWYAQLIQLCKPFIGPSTIVVFGQDKAWL